MQEVKVGRDLKFTEAAQHTDNIEGNWNPKKVHWVDDFTGKTIDATNDYTFAAVNSGTATITAPHCCTITTGGADDDDADLATGLDYYGQYNAVLEVRARNDDVSALGMNIGFSDAQGEAADKIAMTYSGTTLTSNASDFAGFMHDPDATTDKIYCVSVKGDAEGAVIDSGTAEGTDSAWHTYRVELRDNGTTTDAVFWFNADGKAIDPINDYVGFEADAITRTTALCVYIAVINREGAANTFDIDYIKLWSDRY